MNMTLTDRGSVCVATTQTYNDGSIARWVYLDEFENSEEFLAFCHAFYADIPDPEFIIVERNGISDSLDVFSNDWWDTFVTNMKTHTDIANTCSGQIILPMGCSIEKR
jgi:hypothetical protein